MTTSPPSNESTAADSPFRPAAELEVARRELGRRRAALEEIEREARLTDAAGESSAKVRGKLGKALRLARRVVGVSTRRVELLQDELKVPPEVRERIEELLADVLGGREEFEAAAGRAREARQRFIALGTEALAIASRQEAAAAELEALKQLFGAEIPGAEWELPRATIPARRPQALMAELADPPHEIAMGYSEAKREARALAMRIGDLGLARTPEDRRRFLTAVGRRVELAGRLQEEVRALEAEARRAADLDELQEALADVKAAELEELGAE